MLPTALQLQVINFVIQDHSVLTTATLLTFMTKRFLYILLISSKCNRLKTLLIYLKKSFRIELKNFERNLKLQIKLIRDIVIRFHVNFGSFSIRCNVALVEWNNLSSTETYLINNKLFSVTTFQYSALAAKHNRIQASR